MKGNGCALLLVALVLLMVLASFIMGKVAPPEPVDPPVPSREEEYKEPRGNNMDWFGMRSEDPDMFKFSPEDLSPRAKAGVPA
jgi:hypothetical protein